MPTRFILIGGFLGAGKTTAIARLASICQARGQHVAIVTNDKAPELVDTLSLMAQGYPVAELAGTCFCGNVDELTAAVDSLRLAAPPDVVFAEPVGSCIDMVATVIRPLSRQAGGVDTVASYGVLLKPSHGIKILRGETAGGFSPKAAYLFRKQLEEADFIAINRVDQLRPDELAELKNLLASRYPGKHVVAVSARSGEGFDELVRLLDAPPPADRATVEVDERQYAAGEAELGWLNAGLIVTTDDPFKLDTVLLELVNDLRERLLALEVEAAHLKILGAWGGRSAVANLISSELPGELSRPSELETSCAHLTVNARVACAPELIAQTVRSAVDQLAASRQARVEWQQFQSFRPGMPSRGPSVLDMSPPRKQGS